MIDVIALFEGVLVLCRCLCSRVCVGVCVVSVFGCVCVGVL